MIDELHYKKILTSAFKSHYLESSDEWTNDPELRSIPSLIQGFLKIHQHPLNILDLGCGTGNDCEYFARLGNTVLGVDLYPHDYWDTVQSRYHATRFICDEFSQTSFNTTFDIILDNGCFHHQHPNTYEKYLQKIHTLLNSHGHFVLSTFKAHHNRMKTDPKGRLHKYFNDDEINDLLTRSRFTIVHQIDIYRINKNDYYRLTFAKI
ncbi:MAG: class I SAM-dependent methyltransferase [Gammaproteobacteria bacterium]|nr:class I SAM-dependent methyltransferase [Gammaproteobacteria bacterium]